MNKKTVYCPECGSGNIEKIENSIYDVAATSIAALLGATSGVFICPTFGDYRCKDCEYEFDEEELKPE